MVQNAVNALWNKLMIIYKKILFINKYLYICQKYIIGPFSKTLQK